MAELNEMIAARDRGDEVDFDGFMSRYGDMFPENPKNLDELLEILARRMAAMSRLMASLTPQQPPPTCRCRKPSGRLPATRELFNVHHEDRADRPGRVASIRTGLARSFTVLSWSLIWLVFGLCVVLPWAVVVYGIYRLVQRFLAQASALPTTA